MQKGETLYDSGGGQSQEPKSRSIDERKETLKTGFKEYVRFSNEKTKKIRKTLKKIRGIESDEDGAKYARKFSKHVAKETGQERLTEEKLKEEITRILTCKNPNAPENIVVFNYHEKSFRPLQYIDQTVVLYFQEASIFHKDSEEGQQQLLKEEEVPESVKSDTYAAEPSEAGSSEAILEAEDQAEFAAKIADASEFNDLEALEAEAEEPSAEPKVPPRKLPNKFNFYERASQTLNNPNRANQWQIYDAYEEDFERSQREKEKMFSKPAGVRKEAAGPLQRSAYETRKRSPGEAVQLNMSRAVHVLERMVNQNVHDQIAQDFRYWEDASDEFKELSGTLLPLWCFSTEGISQQHVTGLCWNPTYDDLFVAGYGSYNFLNPTPGVLMLHSLKNPSYAERTFFSSSAVNCVDFHPRNANFLAVGLYNGNILVYDLYSGKDKPAWETDTLSNRHMDVVWKVLWGNEDLDNRKTLYSVSADGYVCHWTLAKDQLRRVNIMLLTVNAPIYSEDVEFPETVVACGTCMAFHPHHSNVYLIGTEEGIIYKCSTLYNFQTLQTFRGHYAPIYGLGWNPFHQHVFISCSEDWTVKIWDDNYKEPLFVYDLFSAVGCVEWAPYSSTVFAACTSEGKVHVYDLSQKKYQPMCTQTVAQKKNMKLYHLAFNKKYPIIIVGDDRGHIVSYKLSPNLRKVAKDAVKAPDKSKLYDIENSRLEKILHLVRDPTEMKAEL